MMLRHGILLAVLTAVATAASDCQATDPLKAAKSLAETTYKDWTYGPKKASKQIDCVQFLHAVVEECIGPVSAKVRRQILISNLSSDEVKRLADLIEDSDPKIRGVQQALVDLKKGTVITPDKAQPGDLIQYWMKKDNGKWFGHGGVVETISEKNGTVTTRLFGAHKSSKGIATSKFELKLNEAADRRLFVVRVN